MKLLLQERGIDVKGMTADKIRHTMGAFPDFSSQKTILEEVVHSRGHICLFFPKYHCEINPIERNWSHGKRVARQYVNGSIVKLREVVLSSLDSVTDEMMNEHVETMTWHTEVAAEVKR